MGARKNGGLSVLWAGLLAVAMVAGLFGCGKSGGGNTGQNAPPVEGGKVTLYSWGAPWCAPCQAELSGISQALASDPQLKGRVNAILYVPMGAGAPDLDDSELQQFAQQSAPGFTVKADHDWSQFMKYVNDIGHNVPADVVVDLSGTAKRFSKVSPPVPTAETVVGYLRSKVK